MLICQKEFLKIESLKMKIQSFTVQYFAETREKYLIFKVSSSLLVGVYCGRVQLWINSMHFFVFQVVSDYAKFFSEMYSEQQKLEYIFHRSWQQY